MEPDNKSLVVKSAVKDYAHELEFRIGDDALAQLSQRIETIVLEAAKRAKANGRQTIKECDV